MNEFREKLRDKKRIVVKIGSSSLQHAATGELDYGKMDIFVRELCNLKNQGKEVVLVTSGAVAAGRKAVGISKHEQEACENSMAIKQACAAIGQARLMLIYEKLFAEYNQLTAQILMTKYTIMDNVSNENAHNTFAELLKMGVIPIVNENDTVATDELGIGDNDTLSAIVANLVGADLLILLSDIDGLYSDDPRKNKEAKFIHLVEELTEEYEGMAKESTGSNVGTGGMNTKLTAAKIATKSGADMIIANSVDVKILSRLIAGSEEGTLFLGNKDNDFDLKEFMK